MIYVLVYRSFDYYRFDDAIAASTDLDILVGRVPQGRENLAIYRENSPFYEKDRPKLSFNEIPHFVIMEFPE